MNIATFAPLYNPEEINNINRLNKYLNSCNYDTYSPMLEAEIIKGMAENKLSEDKIKTLSILSLSLDIYNIASVSSCCIGVINGRVPDESTIIKLGIAYILGAPVYLLKNDSRIAFITGDNSMILGLSKNKVYNNLDKLIKEIKKSELRQRVDIANYPDNIRLLIELGEEVHNLWNTDNDIDSLIDKFRDNALINQYLNLNSKSNEPSEIVVKNKVYCSGPLFSPDEQRDMQKISDNLEKNGYTTYLPQRDGAEPFVMNSVNNPFAGSPIARPVTNYINKLIFNVDVMEIVRCRYFLLNINGRAYDEGAMAEVGMAFALGKPIAIYGNDNRCFVNGRVHPLLQAIIMGEEIVRDNNPIHYALSLMNYNNAMYINNNVARVIKSGERSVKKLRRLRVPKNKMLTWLEGYDE